MQDKTDEALMILICKGNEKAFTELYQRYKHKLLYFFYKMLNCDEEKSQDFLQDLFIKIIERPEQFDTNKKFSTWIYTVASNMCKNEFRNIQNRRLILNALFSGSVESAFIQDNIDYNLFMREYKIIFNQMNKEQQLLIVLRFQQELQVQEIAEIMGIPEGTIKSRLFYLLKKLAVRLSEFNPVK